MYVVIVGCGRVGYYLTKTLLDQGHEVVVIERDPDVCQRVGNELGSVVFQGDGTEVNVLKEAGVARAEVFIAVAKEDEDNLAACQLAKLLFHIPKTLALVKEPQDEALFKRLGVDVTINRTRLMFSNIVQQIPGPSMLYLMNLKSLNMEMVSVYIPFDAAVVGKSLGDIEIPPNSFITLVIKETGPVLPSADLIIGSDDEIVAVTTPEEEPQLYEVLTGVG